MKTFLRAALPVMAVYCLAGTVGCKKGMTVLTSDSSSNGGTVTVIPFTSDPASRTAALADYQANYLGSAISTLGWTGNSNNCEAGTTPDSVKQKILQRLNYFRRLAGLPPATLNSDYSAKAQQAALMMKDNNALNHYPPSTWKCTTPDGQLAAANSNLALGVSGPAAIDLYINDAGENNLGHRRWALFPPLTQVGTGDTDFSNALWVIGGFGTRPSVTFTSYPGSGYIPAALVYDTWSLSMSAADFSNATVQVVDVNGNNYPVATATTDNGYGDNTLSWTLQNNPATGLTKDLQLNVTVSGVKVGGQIFTSSYSVYIFVP